MKKIYKKCMLVFSSIFLCFSNIFAETIQKSKLAVGIEKFVNDLTSWLIGISLTAGVTMAVFCLIRTFLTNDEMEQRKWKNHLKVVIICCVCIVCVNVILKMILSYFS